VSICDHGGRFEYRRVYCLQLALLFNIDIVLDDVVVIVVTWTGSISSSRQVQVESRCGQMRRPP
jgi:hypothetical protein